MKHLKAANRKAEAVTASVEKAAVKKEVEEDVIGMAQPIGCTTIFNPGWEANPWGGASSMCAPMEADLLSCANLCWWPAQVPDSLQNAPEWAKGCSSMIRKTGATLTLFFPNPNKSGSEKTS